MKTTTFALAAVSLLQLASAQPFRVRHAHQHAKKDVVVTVVNTVYAAATAGPNVIVYVDGDGKPYSTSTEGVAAAPVSTAAAIVAQDVQSASSVAPVVVPSASASAASSSTSSSSSGFGFSYSPYNSDGTCKTQGQVTTDFNAIPSGYGMVRIYGTDCNQVTTVLTAAKAKGLKLFAGVYDITQVSTEIALIVKAANGDWTSFDTISIGNELVNAGSATAAQVVAAISTARSLLKTAGYTGSVVTVDTLVAARSNPSLCDNSDYCAVNCHPFFDGGVAAAGSGSFLTTQIPTLQAVLSNKSQRIVITETGWPSRGDTNGNAVPSSENQSAAISSIKSAFTSSPSNVILFTTFNTMWKKNTAAQFNAEQYWGFLGSCPSG
ncbi:glycoside hydrolase superfamily [Tricladium varicosporioides]|nr:glycoside hydrolase superfamily [Hymenoscyphus varicosporioides]